MTNSIIFRVGNIVYVHKGSFDGAHGERFILENVSVEDYDTMNAKSVRFRLRCTHCLDFTGEFQCMISKEIIRQDLELENLKTNLYTVTSVHYNDKSLVISRTLCERSGIFGCIRPDLSNDFFKPEPKPRKETNPNILFKFQKRYGELKR